VPYGTFLLADISGYSKYLDEAGLQHASSMAAKLLNSLIDANRKRWRVANLEGDAVFFVRDGRVPPEDVLSFVRDLFGAFYDRILDISQDIDCGCGACGSANRLTVKFIVHAGQYQDREIGGRREVIGPEVVVAHRLLKPEVGISEYLLFTRAYLGDESFTALPTTERVLELDQPVPFVAGDMTPVRREMDASHATFVGGRDAVRTFELAVAAPPERVWTALTAPHDVRVWSGASNVLAYPALGGLVGTSYQWILADGHQFGQLLIAADDLSLRVTLRRDDVPLVGYVYTTYSVDRRDGGSLVRCAQGVSRRRPVASRLIAREEGRHPQIGCAVELERLKLHCESTA
jgi:uncharacterized protein DUF2652